MEGLEGYWKKRQGFVIGSKDDSINGCIVFEIAPFDGACIYEPICMQNGFPFEAVRNYDDRYKGELFCYIERIHLAKEHRGEGIGNEMLEDCIRIAKGEGVKGIFIIVSPEEEMSFSMEKWIASKGFSVISRIDDDIPLMFLNIGE